MGQRKPAKKATRGRKTPQKTPMRTPSHGRGQLRVGGTNKGGPGRPPDEVRKALTGSFADRQATLEAFADDRKLDPVTRMKAIEVLARYGLGTANSLSLSTIDRDWVVAQLAAVRRIVREMLTPHQADALLARIASETFVHE